MPLPLLIGAAALAGAFGVKKGLDAKKDYDEAERYNNQAKETYEDAQYYLENQRYTTEKAIKNLGLLKAYAFQDCLIPFVQTYEKIQNIELDNNIAIDGHRIPITSLEYQEIKQIAFQMEDILSAGVQSLGSGALAGLGALGGVATFASASTGTAIASLGGAAATNATLAWLGGGSLASGGLGMAGGAAVLGGIVAGPVLAVGGLIMANKAEEAKENALANLHQAEYDAEQMNIARVRTRDIQYRAEDLYSAIDQLMTAFKPLLANFQELVSQETCYEHYSPENRKGVMIVVVMAKALKKLLETPIMNSSGYVQSIDQAVFDAQESLVDSENAIELLNYIPLLIEEKQELKPIIEEINQTSTETNIESVKKNKFTVNPKYASVEFADENFVKENLKTDLPPAESITMTKKNKFTVNSKYQSIISENDN